MINLNRVLRILQAPVCRCGRAKPVRQAVCARCWHRLPADLRDALYSRVGSGFETAYDRACELLKQEGLAL